MHHPTSASALSRRTLLRGTGALALASLATPALATPALATPALAQVPDSPRDILVLGAGMSGLTAALALARLRHRVTVIEYQDRIGGRLLSVPLGDGMFSEAGGGHFRSNMALVLHYVRRFGLPLLSMNDGLPRYNVGGHSGNAADLAGWPWQLAADERNVSVASTLNRYLYRAGLDTETVLRPDWPDQQTVERLDHITLGDLIREVGASDAYCSLLDAHGGTFTTRSQALGAICDLAYHFGDQNLFRIKGGNNRLPMALASAIGPDSFVLNAPVAAIDQTGSRVVVTIRDGREFSGDAVVSAIPFGVMGEIEVRPGWSPGKARMMTQMGWDRTVKVIVKTATPAWLGKNVHGWPMAGGDRRWERVIDITGNEPGGHGSAFFYLNGSNADWVLAMPHEDRAAAVLDAFRADNPDLLGDVLHAEPFAWSEQPWIRGSFGGPGLGESWMMKEWSTPDDRIHFAGDFTTLKTGWVEGAIESGLRAARQIDPRAMPEGVSR